MGADTKGMRNIKYPDKNQDGLAVIDNASKIVTHY